MSSTSKTTSSGNGARAKALKMGPQPCRAIALVRQWMDQKGFNVAKLSRRLDRTWECTNNIVTGKERPNVDAVVFFRDEAGVPVSAWMEPGK